MNSLLTKLAEVPTGTETATPANEINGLTGTPTKPKECMKTEDFSNSSFLRRELKFPDKLVSQVK